MNKNMLLVLLFLLLVVLYTRSNTYEGFALSQTRECQLARSRIRNTTGYVEEARVKANTARDELRDRQQRKASGSLIRSSQRDFDTKFAKFQELNGELQELYRAADRGRCRG